MPTFSPPTHEEPMRTKTRPLNYYRLTHALSVVRVNGTFTAVRSPSSDLLTTAGVSGTDYFIGGHVYTVTSAIATELTNAGFGSGIS